MNNRAFFSLLLLLTTPLTPSAQRKEPVTRIKKLTRSGNFYYAIEERYYAPQNGLPPYFRKRTITLTDATMFRVKKPWCNPIVISTIIPEFHWEPCKSADIEEELFETTSSKPYRYAHLHLGSKALNRFQSRYSLKDLPLSIKEAKNKVATFFKDASFIPRVSIVNLNSKLFLVFLARKLKTEIKLFPLKKKSRDSSTPKPQEYIKAGQFLLRRESF